MTVTTRLSDLTGDYAIDTAHTRVGFIARHTMANNVPGRFEAFEGRVRLDGYDATKSSAELHIQAASLQTGNSRRDMQVRSKFLDADNHPTIRFTSTGAEQVGEVTFKITGNLSIRQATRPVEVDVRLTQVDDDPSGRGRVRFAGRAIINRRDWGVHWAAALGLAAKLVTLDLDVVAIRQS